MAIHGSLGTMSAAELLQWASAGGKTGTLVITTRSSVKRIGFDEGWLVFSSSNDEKRTLGKMLIENGSISEDVHERALRIRYECRIAVGKVLLDLNAVSEEQIIQCLRHKAEDEIGELLFCTEGEFSFYDKDLPELDLLPMRLDVTGAILEGARRIDEQRHASYH